MIEYSDKQKEIIRNYNSKKNLTIKFLDDDSFEDINGDRIYWESLNLIESLCDSNNLIFGSCESSEMQIQVADVPLDIKNHEIQLDLTVDEILVPLGIFFIADVEKATDRRYKKLKCYDRMYYMQTDVIEWYNTIFPTVETTMTLKEFRDSFFNWMGLEQEDTTLVNDNIIIRKTIDATELSGLDVITAICEINGAFGHFNRNGIFQYVYLENNAVYPSETLYPRDDLYPGGGRLEEITNAYYIPPSEQGDYIVRSINKLQVRQEDGDIGAIVTSKQYTKEENNSYIINSNFLVYGASAEELDNIAENLSTKIFGITYAPNSTNTVAMPYMEVGDSFFVSSSKTPFTSYILKRTLSGIQGMRDLWEAKGDEFQSEIVSENNKEIIQLRSRVNILTRTVDENKLEISRVETNLKGNYSTTTEMNSAITQSANNITQTVSETYQVKGDYATNSSVSTRINQTARSISLSASGGENSVGITIKLLDAYGNVIDSKTDNANIEITGVVKFTDLSNSGNTIINGDNITTGTINANKVAISNLVVGENVSMGANATISWNNVTNHPSFITGETATQITKDTVTTSYVNALNVKAGSVDAENISGTTITGKELRQFWGQDNFVFSVNSGHIEWNMNGVRNWISPEGINLETLGQVLHLNLCDDFKLAQFMVANGGKVYANGYYNAIGNYPTLSDKRIKNDLGYLDIDKTAKFVYSLKPTQFTYKKDKSKAIHHGLYAQDVEQSMDGEKWALFEDNSCTLSAPTDFRYKMMDYPELIADLIATAQSQNKRIDRLEFLKG